MFLKIDHIIIQEVGMIQMMNIGMIPNTMFALAFVAKQAFASSVEFAGVVLS